MKRRHWLIIPSVNSTDTPDITVDLDDNEAEAIYQAFQQGQLDSVDLKGIFARPAEWLAESDTDVAYDIRQARAAAGPEGACYVNVYSIDRAYGPGETRADGTVRTNAKNPQGRLAIDEIAIPIDVTIPDAWGRVRAAAITVAMPEPPDVIDTSDRPTSEGSAS